MPHETTTGRRARQPRDSFRVEVTRAGGDDVVSLHGDLDLLGATRLRGVHAQVPRTARVVLIDLRALTFLDCSGLGALLRLRREVHVRGARVFVLVPRGRALRLFQLAGLTSIVSIVPRPAQ